MTPIRSRFIAFMVVMGLLISVGCTTTSRDRRDRSAQAHYKLGISYLNNDQLQQAFVEFQKALESNSAYGDVHYALGHVYYRRGQFEEAKNEFLMTIRIKPDYAEAHNYLGKAYEQMGKWDLAIAQYKKALANLQYRTPHFAQYNLGVALMNINDYEGALNEFVEAVRVEPSFMAAHHGMGQAYSKLNRYGEAVEAFQEAIRLAPESPRVHFYLGAAYFKEGARLRAREAFEKAIELAPEGEFAKESRRYLDRLQSSGE